MWYNGGMSENEKSKINEQEFYEMWIALGGREPSPMERDLMRRHGIDPTAQMGSYASGYTEPLGSAKPAVTVAERARWAGIAEPDPRDAIAVESDDELDEVAFECPGCGDAITKLWAGDRCPSCGADTSDELELYEMRDVPGYVLERLRTESEL